MANKQHAQFSDENGNIYYLENQTEDVLDPSGKPLSDGGDLSEASVTFTADSTRTLPKSGSRFKAFCGSVLKFLSDLKTVSFSGSYNDLSNKPSIPSGAAASQAVANNCTTTAAGSVLDARQGKVLMDKANQLNSDLAESKKWTLLNVAADLEISQEMINTHEEFLITVVSNDTVLGSIILPAWHSIFQSGEYVGKYLHLGGWYHNAESCGMIRIYKFRDIGWTTNPDLHCCSIDGQYVTVNIALFGR